MTFKGTVVRAPFHPSDNVCFFSIKEDDLPNGNPIQVVVFTKHRYPSINATVASLCEGDHVVIEGRKTRNPKTQQLQIELDNIYRDTIKKEEIEELLSDFLVHGSKE